MAATLLLGMAALEPSQASTIQAVEQDQDAIPVMELGPIAADPLTEEIPALPDSPPEVPSVEQVGEEPSRPAGVVMPDSSPAAITSDPFATASEGAEVAPELPLIEGNSAPGGPIPPPPGPEPATVTSELTVQFVPGQLPLPEGFPNPPSNVGPIPPQPQYPLQVPPQYPPQPQWVPRTEPRGGGGLPEALPDADQPTLSLRVNNQDIRQALELLAAQAGVNIIPSQGVSGSVSITLEDVTFDRALDILLRIADLEARREGNLIFVYTAAEAEDLRLRENEPIVRVYHLNYVRAFDIFAMISPFLSPQGTISLTPPSAQGITGAGGAGAFGGSTGGIVGGAGGVGLVGGGGGLVGPGGAGAGGTAGGMALGGNMAGGGFPGPVGGGRSTGGDSFAMHDMVVVRDFPENVKVIDEIVARLDVEPLQVLIEAVIISVELRDGQELGVNFAVVDKLATEAIVSGSGTAINLAGGFSPAQVLSAAASPPAPPQLGAYLGDRPGQLLPAYLADQGLKYGFVSNSVAGFIRALETLNKINILASPRLLVLNKQLAEIQLGQRLGYATTFTNLTTASEQVQFIPIGTLLSIRPFVSQEGMIRLEIHPERSSGFIDANGIPQLTTSELTTNIMAPDGATIVIGGLIDNTDEIREDGVLGLNRLPFVGPLFRTRTMQARKQELLVLLTPRIINRDGGLPKPVPGSPPVGPSGVPNSGPMPGQPYFVEAGCEMPVLAPTLLDPDVLMRRSSQQTLGAASGLRELISNDFGSAAPSSVDEMLQAAQMTAARDASTEPPEAEQPAQDDRPWWDPRRSAPTKVTHDTPKDPSPSPTTPEASPADETERGYRPGDLTRAMFSRIAQRRKQPDSPSPTMQGPAPSRVQVSSQSAGPAAPVAAPAASPARDASVTAVGIAQHVVGPGENFQAIADRYYGNPALHAALWAVNRHTTPAPEGLQPGMTLILPPTEVLERVYIDAVQTTLRTQSPAEPVAPASAEPNRRRRFPFFGTR
ncbi:secretin and TonB N-terminal domain-containing protein [Tautonia marina]|uniref:secretin and TonB N-terminal domain-containing protein n=1 Tax=Tautonia marina TaxID=2653855 RepID=UPI001375B90F|nr:secretin and TonB N-terminal domain-containing protein [Tautonia marina]